MAGMDIIAGILHTLQNIASGAEETVEQDFDSCKRWIQTKRVLVDSAPINKGKRGKAQGGRALPTSFKNIGPPGNSFDQVDNGIHVGEEERRGEAIGKENIVLLESAGTLTQGASTGQAELSSAPKRTTRRSARKPKETAGTASVVLSYSNARGVDGKPHLHDIASEEKPSVEVGTDDRSTPVDLHLPESSPSDGSCNEHNHEPPSIAPAAVANAGASAAEELAAGLVEATASATAAKPELVHSSSSPREQHLAAGNGGPEIDEDRDHQKEEVDDAAALSAADAASNVQEQAQALALAPPERHAGVAPGEDAPAAPAPAPAPIQTRVGSKRGLKQSGKVAGKGHTGAPAPAAEGMPEAALLGTAPEGTAVTGAETLGGAPANGLPRDEGAMEETAAGETAMSAVCASTSGAEGAGAGASVGAGASADAAAGAGAAGEGRATRARGGRIRKAPLKADGQQKKAVETVGGAAGCQDAAAQREVASDAKLEAAAQAAGPAEVRVTRASRRIRDRGAPLAAAAAPPTAANQAAVQAHQELTGAATAAPAGAAPPETEDHAHTEGGDSRLSSGEARLACKGTPAATVSVDTDHPQASARKGCVLPGESLPAQLGTQPQQQQEQLEQYEGGSLPARQEHQQQLSSPGPAVVADTPQPAPGGGRGETQATSVEEALMPVMESKHVTPRSAQRMRRLECFSSGGHRHRLRLRQSKKRSRSRGGGGRHLLGWGESNPPFDFLGTCDSADLQRQVAGGKLRKSAPGEVWGLPMGGVRYAAPAVIAVEGQVALHEEPQSPASGSGSDSGSEVGEKKQRRSEGRLSSSGGDEFLLQQLPQPPSPSTLSLAGWAQQQDEEEEEEGSRPGGPSRTSQVAPMTAQEVWDDGAKMESTMDMDVCSSSTGREVEVEIARDAPQLSGASAGLGLSSRDLMEVDSVPDLAGKRAQAEAEPLMEIGCGVEGVAEAEAEAEAEASARAGAPPPSLLLTSARCVTEASEQQQQQQLLRAMPFPAAVEVCVALSSAPLTRAQVAENPAPLEARAHKEVVAAADGREAGPDEDAVHAEAAVQQQQQQQLCSPAPPISTSEEDFCVLDPSKENVTPGSPEIGSKSRSRSGGDKTAALLEAVPGADFVQDSAVQNLHGENVRACEATAGDDGSVAERHRHQDEDGRLRSPTCVRQLRGALAGQAEAEAEAEAELESEAGPPCDVLAQLHVEGQQLQQQQDAAGEGEGQQGQVPLQAGHGRQQSCDIFRSAPEEDKDEEKEEREQPQPQEQQEASHLDERSQPTTAAAAARKSAAGNVATAASNLVSTLTSFLPFVNRHAPAAPPAAGKKGGKVRALEAAEAARRDEERRALERRLRRAAVEKAKEDNKEREADHRDKDKQQKARDAPPAAATNVAPAGEPLGALENVSAVAAAGGGGAGGAGGLFSPSKNQSAAAMSAAASGVSSAHAVHPTSNAGVLSRVRKAMDAKSKMEAEKARRLEEERRRKEEEWKKKESELAGRKRQREEAERREREDKRRRCQEEAVRARREAEEKQRADLEEKERRRRAQEEADGKRKAAEDEARRQRRVERERDMERRRKEEEEAKVAKAVEKEAERRRKEELFLKRKEWEEDEKRRGDDERSKARQVETSTAAAPAQAAAVTRAAPAGARTPSRTHFAFTVPGGEAQQLTPSLKPPRGGLFGKQVAPTGATCTPVRASTQAARSSFQTPPRGGPHSTLEKVKVGKGTTGIGGRLVKCAPPGPAGGAVKSAAASGTEHSLPGAVVGGPVGKKEGATSGAAARADGPSGRGQGPGPSKAPGGSLTAVPPPQGNALLGLSSPPPRGSGNGVTKLPAVPDLLKFAPPVMAEAAHQSYEISPKEQLQPQLMAQMRVDPDKIFPPVKICSLSEGMPGLLRGPDQSPARD
eukprot:jgi/Mesen1/10931/ME000095S10275